MPRPTSRQRHAAILFVLAALLVSLLPPEASATPQSTYGTLVGVIEDAAGKPIPNAQVRIVGASGNPKTVRTDGSGNYRVQFLQPGLYTLQVSADGYRDASLAGVRISVTVEFPVVPPIRLSSLAATAPTPAGGEGAPVNGADTPTAGPTPTLPPGNPGPSSEGTAREPLISLFDPTRRANFNSLSLQNVPVPGIRSFDEFAHLVSGVSPAPETLSSVPGPGIGAGIGTAGQFSVNGQRPRSNNFQIDGSDNNDPDVGVRRQGFVALVPQSLESVEEFQISTSLWSAESGRNLGSQVNVVTRLGGDAVHGKVYGFLNHDSLNARDPFDWTSSSLPATSSVFSTATGLQATLDGAPLATTPNLGGEDPYTRLQTGFVVGGPIVRGKTHYFGSFEYQKISASEETNFAVPTLDERGFVRSGGSGLVFPRYEPFDILEPTPAFPTTIVGDSLFSLFPFPNNPLGPYGEHNYTEILPADGRGAIGSIGVDHAMLLFGKETELTGRYNLTDDVRIVPAVGGALFSTIEADTRTQNLSFIATTVLTPRLSNLFRASYGRTRIDFAERRNSYLAPSALASTPFLLNAPVRLNGTFSLANDFGAFRPTEAKLFSGGTFLAEQSLGPLGQIAIGGYSPVGVDVYTFPQERTSRTLQFADTFSYSRAAHNIRFGGDVRPIRLDSDQQRNSRPVATFNPAFYFGNPVRAVAGGGRRLSDAEFILSGADLAALGAPSDYFQTLATSDVSASAISLRFTEWDGFVQDDWRVRPNLTINLGLRYEYNEVPREADNLIEDSFSSDFVRAIPQLEQIVAGRTEIYDADWNNFGPRVGFAWDPFRNGTTVVRGGFGIYYDAVLGAVVSQSRNVAPNFVTFDIGFIGEFKVTDPFFLRNPTLINLIDPGSLNNLRPGTTALDAYTRLRDSRFSGASPALSFVLPERELQSPYAQQFGLTVEHELAFDYAVSASYTGVLSRHLLRANAPNLGPSATPLLAAVLPDSTQVANPISVGIATPITRPYGDLGAFTIFESSGKSSYHGLQLEVKKRYSRFYTLQAAYTWSHSIDDASDVFDLAGSSALPQNPFNLALERASSSFDVRHRFATSLVWDLPWWRDETGVRRALLSGWRVADRIEASSGLPYTIVSTFDIDGNGLLTDRPLDAGIRETGDAANPVTTNVAPLDYVGFLGAGFYDIEQRGGSLGRNAFRGPASFRVDLALVKLFDVTEDVDLELRTEVFNLFNHANYGLPVRYLEAPGFGRATTTTIPSRQVQFALKLGF
jgi:hypothetical protein